MSAGRNLFAFDNFSLCCALIYGKDMLYTNGMLLMCFIALFVGFIFCAEGMFIELN